MGNKGLIVDGFVGVQRDVIGQYRVNRNISWF
jgi:hypothetical protein